MTENTLFNRTCDFPGCGNRHTARGYCATHYAQWWNGKPLTPVQRRAPDICKMPGCGRAHDARGYCGSHYRQFQKGRKEADMKPPYHPVTYCTVESCERPVKAKTLCAPHYEQHRKGRPFTEPKNLRRNEGKGHIDQNGYRRIRYKGAPMMEHRLIMEQTLGRELLPVENVHHKNGVRFDNRPENLEIWVKTQPCGQRPVDLINYLVRHHRSEVEAALRRAT